MVTLNAPCLALQTEVQVFRKGSPSQPALEDTGVDWEETVYLNIILQHVSEIHNASGGFLKN